GCWSWRNSRARRLAVSLNSWLWLTAMGVTMLGAALLSLGLRGRRVNDHPICRKCGFDLVGREDLDQTWGDAVCTECGADLKGRRAIVPGQRAPCRTPRAVGIFLIVIGFGMQG